MLSDSRRFRGGAMALNKFWFFIGRHDSIRHRFWFDQYYRLYQQAGGPVRHAS
jgi:hypothetical protein